jgi:hypothetical protein
MEQIGAAAYDRSMATGGRLADSLTVEMEAWKKVNHGKTADPLHAAITALKDLPGIGDPMQGFRGVAGEEPVSPLPPIDEKRKQYQEYQEELAAADEIEAGTRASRYPYPVDRRMEATEIRDKARYRWSTVEHPVELVGANAYPEFGNEVLTDAEYKAKKAAQTAQAQAVKTQAENEKAGIAWLHATASPDALLLHSQLLADLERMSAGGKPGWTPIEGPKKMPLEWRLSDGLGTNVKRYAETLAASGNPADQFVAKEVDAYLRIWEQRDQLAKENLATAFARSLADTLTSHLGEGATHLTLPPQTGAQEFGQWAGGMAGTLAKYAIAIKVGQRMTGGPVPAGVGPVGALAGVGITAGEMGMAGIVQGEGLTGTNLAVGGAFGLASVVPGPPWVKMLAQGFAGAGTTVASGGDTKTSVAMFLLPFLHLAARSGPEGPTPRDLAKTMTQAGRPTTVEEAGKVIEASKAAAEKNAVAAQKAQDAAQATPGAAIPEQPIPEPGAAAGSMFGEQGAVPIDDMKRAVRLIGSMFSVMRASPSEAEPQSPERTKLIASLDDYVTKLLATPENMENLDLGYLHRLQRRYPRDWEEIYNEAYLYGRQMAGQTARQEHLMEGGEPTRSAGRVLFWGIHTGEGTKVHGAVDYAAARVGVDKRTLGQKDRPGLPAILGGDVLESASGFGSLERILPNEIPSELLEAGSRRKITIEQRRSAIADHMLGTLFGTAERDGILPAGLRPELTAIMEEANAAGDDPLQAVLAKHPEVEPYFRMAWENGRREAFKASEVARESLFIGVRNAMPFLADPRSSMISDEQRAWLKVMQKEMHGPWDMIRAVRDNLTATGRLRLSRAAKGGTSADELSRHYILNVIARFIGDASRKLREAGFENAIPLDLPDIGRDTKAMQITRAGWSAFVEGWNRSHGEDLRIATPAESRTTSRPKWSDLPTWDEEAARAKEESGKPHLLVTHRVTQRSAAGGLQAPDIQTEYAVQTWEPPEEHKPIHDLIRAHEGLRGRIHLVYDDVSPIATPEQARASLGDDYDPSKQYRITGTSHWDGSSRRWVLTYFGEPGKAGDVAFEEILHAVHDAIEASPGALGRTALARQIRNWHRDSGRDDLSTNEFFAKFLSLQLANPQTDFAIPKGILEGTKALLEGRTPISDATFEAAGRIAAERSGTRYEGEQGAVFVEDLTRPIGEALRAIGGIFRFGLRKGLEPAKITEKSLGAETVAQVIRATRGKSDVARLEFDQQKLAQADATVEQFDEWLKRDFSENELRDFMLAYRGRPATAEATAIAAEAEKRLPAGLKSPEVRAAVQELSDSNYEAARAVAEQIEDMRRLGPRPARQLEIEDWARKSLGYYEDYFYGQYKDGPTMTVKEYFTNVWPTNEGWMKSKRIPSPADALAAGLELRHPNPVDNLRAERVAIAGMEGALWERQEAYRNGEGRYVLPNTPENRASHPDWVRIEQSVFKDDIFHPDYAMLHNNLISFNRVMNNPALSKFRSVANFMRSWRLWIPVFHQWNIEKSQLKEIAILGARGRDVGYSMGNLARRMGANTTRTIDNAEYMDYVEHGGSHRTSNEYEAMAQVTKALAAVAKRVVGTRVVRAAQYVNVLRRYRTWLFDSHIPDIKFASYQAERIALEKKLGRPLTSAEKINIVKGQQNIFGEMNEALFGRSGTMTSATRLFYTAPGYSEGNFRTIFDAVFHWTGGRGTNARYFIPLSFALAAGTAAIGTRLATGAWPSLPTSGNQLRDFFKIHTGIRDDRDREILVDALTYEKDYYTFFGHLAGAGMEAAQGRTPVKEIEKVPGELAQRSVGMASGLAQVVSDLLSIATGNSLYDYNGNRVIPIYDTTLKKAAKLAIYELKRIEPISVSGYVTARQHGAGKAFAAVEAVLGARPTFTEDEKDKQDRLRKMYAYKDDGEKLYRFLGASDDPVGDIREYVSKAEDIVGIFPEAEQAKVRLDLKVNRLNDLKRAVSGIVMSDRTPQAKQEAITKVLSTLRESAGE